MSIELHELSLYRDRSRRFERFFEILREYDEGIPIKEIGAKYGISQAYVVRIASKAGLTRYRQRAAMKPHVIADYADGKPIAEIVARYGIDRKSIWSWAKAAGVPLRRPELARPKTAQQGEE